MRARDTAGRVLALPNQTPGLIEKLGLTRADVDRAAWVVDAAGRKWAGAAAVNRALEEWGGVWPLIAGCYSFPIIRWIEDRAYDWIAAHRSQLARWWSTVPECEQPGVNCGDCYG